MAEELVLKGTVCAHTDMVTPIATPVDNVDTIVSWSPNKSIPIDTTTKISDLPVNLVEEILSKVPLKSMGAVRLTCKAWDTLSKSRSFSKVHIDNLSAGESMIVAWIDYNLYLMRVVLVDNEEPLIECKGKLTCSDKQNMISQVIHCDGLLLCVLKEDDTKFIVLNPYWGQTMSIECRHSHCPDRWDRYFSYAIGYEDKGSCRSYKFLRFIDRYYSAPVNQFSCYEIYDLDSSTWKTLDVTPRWRTLYSHRSVSLKGNTYWPASQRNTKYTKYVLDHHIICFDFTSERFGPLLRLPFDAGDDYYVILSCVREEKLAVLLTHIEEGPREFEIWISTKIEAENVSWSKFLRVETKTGYCALVNCGSFLIDEEKKVAMGYYKTFNIVGEDGYLKELELVERAGRYEITVGKWCALMFQV